MNFSMASTIFTMNILQYSCKQEKVYPALNMLCDLLRSVWALNITLEKKNNIHLFHLNTYIEREREKKRMKI